MYLAHPRHTETATYQIRQSYRDIDSDHFRYRLVYDLGHNPGEHLEMVGDRAVLFASSLEEAVGRYARQDPSTILEELLWSFLPHAVRDHIARFDRGRRYVPGPLTDEEQQAIDTQFHIFDRRRLYFLYYRAIDMSRLFTLRPRAYRPLLNQCRDEREYMFTLREQALEPGEYFHYLYAIFNLQHYFPVSFATFLPEALPWEEVADRFVEALCSLSASSEFLDGEPCPSSLHHHLVRYLIMFFDHHPAGRSFEADFVRRFMNQHRTFRWPERQPAASEERISEIFGRPLAALKTMSRKELTRLYRKLAMKLHPDQGGDHERFVELTEIYSTLMRSR